MRDSLHASANDIEQAITLLLTFAELLKFFAAERVGEELEEAVEMNEGKEVGQTEGVLGGVKSEPEDKGVDEVGNEQVGEAEPEGKGKGRSARADGAADGVAQKRSRGQRGMRALVLVQVIGSQRAHGGRKVEQVEKR